MSIILLFSNSIVIIVPKAQLIDF